MSGPEFFQTVMGRHFYDGTMPRVAEALERIADALEVLVQQKDLPGVGGGGDQAERRGGAGVRTDGSVEEHVELD